METRGEVLWALIGYLRLCACGLWGNVGDIQYHKAVFQLYIYIYYFLASIILYFYLELSRMSMCWLRVAHISGFMLN